jgi:hypothetical protein
VSTFAPAKPPEKHDQRAAPPVEHFWVRYSPHYEGPLSGVGSFVIHALVLGLIAMVAMIPIFNRDHSHVPIDSVSLDPGPGGKPSGNVHESGDGTTGDQNPADKERFAEKVNGTLPSIPEPKPLLEDLKDRYIEGVVEKNNEAIKNILSMPKTTANDILKGVAGSGDEESNGKGGTNGDRNGTGDGKFRTKRQERMLRWTMLFDIHTGMDYAKQLRSLGVFIAVEIPDEPGKVRVYESIEPNAKSEVKELKNIYRMPWIDSRRESVGMLCGYMGIRPTPPRIIAYMTEKMEANLLKMELNAAGGVEEDKIDETVFKIVPRAGRYEPIVESQRLK